MSTKSINTIVISDSEKSIELLKKVLLQSGYNVIFEGSNLQQLQEEATLFEPELIVIALNSTDLTMLGQLKIINEQLPLPIVVFTNDDRDDAIERAIEVGVSAYIVDGLSEHRIIPIMRTAVLRFQQHQKMKKQVDELRVSLADRKVIDRAKGLIMQQRQCSEDDAYKMLRTTAMKQNLRLAQLSQNIIDAAVLLNT